MPAAEDDGPDAGETTGGAADPGWLRQTGRDGCWALMPAGPAGAFRDCSAPVTGTGAYLTTTTEGDGDRDSGVTQMWQVFVCDRHTDGAVAVRALLDRDRELLGRWRDEAERWRPGGDRRPELGPWRPPRPLATGPAATALWDRAQRWAARPARAEPS